VLPVEGPVPYLPDDGRAARDRFAGELPAAARTWWHVTWEPMPAVAARQGLIPSCWRGGDCCVVFGHDERFEPSGLKGDVVIEVRSRALPGQLKALWVPWWCIVGAWRRGRFVSAEQLRQEEVELVDPTAGCGCGLTEMMREQQALWRSTWLAER
jgi:hypothetical protein